MSKLQYLCFIGVLILLPTIIVAQSASSTEGCAPFAAQFSGTGFYWDFGNGSTSSETDPSTVYGVAGDYTVSVYEFENGPLVTTIAMTVYDVPTLSIQTNVDEGCVPFEVDLSYSGNTSSIPINGVRWIFGDGTSVEATGDRVSHTYRRAGDFTVTVELLTDVVGCRINGVATDLITANATPEAAFLTDPQSSCTVPLIIDVNNLTTDVLPVSYQWDFANGNTSTATNPPAQTYATDGQYDIQLIATNSKTCRDTATFQLNVGSPQGVINVPDTICLDAGVLFEFTNANRVTWGFDDGAEFFNSEERRYESVTSIRSKSIEIFYRTGGVKTITLEIRNGGCNNSVSKDIFVQEVMINPTASIPYSCDNPVEVQYSGTTDANSPSYVWLFDDGARDTAQNSDFTYFSPDDTVFYGNTTSTIYPAQLIAIDGSTGCYDTATVNFNHHPIQAKVLVSESSARGCAPITVEFQDSVSHDISDPIVKWSWHFGDGSSPVEDTAPGSLTHTYSSGGTYEVFLAIESQSGCTDSSFHVNVKLGEDVSSSLAFAADKTTICRGEEVELGVTSSIPGIDAFHFYSDGNRIFHQPDDSVVNWSFSDEVGPQDVTLQVDINGCLSQITYDDYIQVNGAVAEMAFKSECETPYDYQFTDLSDAASGTATLTWDFGDAANSAASDPLHTYAGRGDFDVLLIAEDVGSGCPADSVTATVRVREPLAVLAAPVTACGGTDITLDAAGSQDPACRGYTFRFPTFEDEQRPITWDKSTATVTVPESDSVSTHLMELIITDDHGCKDTARAELKPFTLSVEATVDASQVCLPQLLQLGDSTMSDTTIVSWNWIISNGDTLTAQHPDYRPFTEPMDNDSLYISLTVTDVLGCTSGVGDTLFRLPYYELNARLNVLTDSVCAPDAVAFEGIDRRSQGLEFLWDFGNGKIDSVAGPSVVYDTAGTYQVQMKFSQTTSGCIDSLSTTVVVQESPEAGFQTDVDGLAVFCNPQTITFSDTSSASFGVDQLYWDFDNGEISNDANYTLAYTKGNYDVSLIATTSFGCSDTVRRSFEVVGPEVEFAMDRDQICEGEEITFEITRKVDVDSLIWIFGDGADSINIDLVTHAYGQAPSNFRTVANLFVYSDNGCFDVATDTVNFYQLEAGFQINNAAGQLDSIFCLNDEALFVDTSINADRFSWDFGDGNVSAEASPSYLYGAAGDYEVLQVVENQAWGCVDSTRMMLAIKGFPATALTLSDDSLCLGEALNVAVATLDSMSRYEWSAGVLTDLGFGQATATPDQTFRFSLTETDQFGCVTSIDSLVTVLQPYQYADWDTTLQQGKTARLPIVLDSLHSFVLTPSEGLSCLDCNYPEVTPEEDVFYTLTISDEFGCFVDAYSLSVFVIPPSFISMPETFTPNGDGVNDVVFAQGWLLEELLEFQIFNRLGELVFSTKNLDEGWDGTFNGREQATDVFVYKVKAIGVDGQTVVKEGYLNLIR